MAQASARRRQQAASKESPLGRDSFRPGLSHSLYRVRHTATFTNVMADRRIHAISWKPNESLHCDEPIISLVGTDIVLPLNSMIQAVLIFNTDGKYSPSCCYTLKTSIADGCLLLGSLYTDTFCDPGLERLVYAIHSLSSLSGRQTTTIEVLHLHIPSCTAIAHSPDLLPHLRSSIRCLQFPRCSRSSLPVINWVVRRCNEEWREEGVERQGQGEE